MGQLGYALNFIVWFLFSRLKLKGLVKELKNTAFRHVLVDMVDICTQVLDCYLTAQQNIFTAIFVRCDSVSSIAHLWFRDLQW